MVSVEIAAQSRSAPAGIEASIVSSVALVGNRAWCSARALEFAYLRACEAIAPAPCKLGAVRVQWRGVTVAVAPTFTATIPIEIVFNGSLKSAAESLTRRFPKLTAWRVMGLGSPYWNRTGMLFDPRLDQEARLACLEQAVTALERRAKAEGCIFTVIKDASDDELASFGHVLDARRYARLPALPHTTLNVPESSQAYIEGLSANMRSNMRRKLKKAADLEIETLTSLDGIEDEILAMRAETIARAKVDFDLFTALPPSYFSTILAEMPGEAFVRLYKLGSKPIGFALVLANDREVVETFTGMHYPVGPDNGLFFRNWMEHIEDARMRGMKQIETGPTTYLTKARLNCTFHRSWLCVRGMNPILNLAVRWLAPRLGLDRDDADLNQLGDKARYDR